MLQKQPFSNISLFTTFMLTFLLGMSATFASADSSSISSSKVTSLVLENPTKFDGILHANGKLYGAAGWDGSAIYEINPDGTIKKLGTVPNGPIDMVTNAEGDLVITSYGAKAVYKLDLETGETSVIAKLPHFAGSIVNYNPGEYLVGSSGKLYWINEAGDVDVYFDDRSRFANPTGLIMDDERNVYVGSLAKATVFKIDDKTKAVTELATLPVKGQYNIGKLLFIDGALYATHLATHTLYKIAIDGTGHSVLSGIEKLGKEMDGALNAAQFLNPNGMAWDESTRTMWIAPAFGTATQLRKITLAP
jgi:sugar lactone lactonase YvrE